MKLPFKLALPTFGKRRKASEDEDDDDGIGRGMVDDDDEDGRLASSQTIILDDPDAEDEEDPGIPAMAPDGGRPQLVADDRRGDGAVADDVAAADNDPPPFAGSFSDNDDRDDDDDNDDGEGRRRPTLLIAAAAALAGILAVGGGAWWWLSGEPPPVEQVAGMPPAASDVPSVTVELPPPPRAAAAGSLNSMVESRSRAPQDEPPGGPGAAPAGALAPPPSAATEPAMSGEEQAAPSPDATGTETPAPMAAGQAPEEQAPAAAEPDQAAAESGQPPEQAHVDGAAPTAEPAPATLNAVAEAAEDPDAGIIVASASPQAFAGLPTPPTASPLPPVPDPGLIEEGEHGKLPRVDGDGRRPWRIYARPFTPPEGRETWPRIAILMGGLGLGQAPTEAAIRSLPAAVSLVFDPYAKNLQQWVPRAREAGHEFLIALPMEPADFPVTDPGPMGLLTTLEPAEMRKRLDGIFGRMTGYVGIFGQHGSRYMTDEKDVMPVLTAMKWRGLMFVDGSGSAESLGPVYAEKINLAMAAVQVVLDREPTAMRIDEQLAALETVARANKAAVGLGHPYPRTLERLAAWVAGLEEKGILLVPVTAVVKGEEKE